LPPKPTKAASDDAVLISNHHTDPLPKALAQAVARGDYVSYFENEHGEQWFFTRQREADHGFAYGGDLGWESSEVRDRTRDQVRKHLRAGGSRPGNLDMMEEMVDPLAPDIILNSHERAWLNAAWETSSTCGTQAVQERIGLIANRIASRANAAGLSKHPNNSDYRAAMSTVMVEVGIEAGRRGLGQNDTVSLIQATLRALPRPE
jgi:hypothetical protein